MNVLLTSSGRRSYLVRYFKEAVGEAGRVFAANSTPCPAFHVADEAVVTPIIYDNDYIPFLLEYCKRNAIDLLVPLFDIDIPVLAENKQAFAEQGTLVVVADLEVALVCNDKWRTAHYLAQHGVRVPCTALGIDEAYSFLSLGKMTYPVMVKPRWGMASLGTHIARNDAELEVLHNIVQNEIDNSYLKYESQANQGPSVIVQELLDGQEYGLDVMCDLEGAYQSTSVKRKLAMRSGETDSAVVVDSEELRELGRELATLCPHPGNLDVDVFVCEAGCYVLELNARFGGGYPFTHAAGVDLPRALVLWRMGENVGASLITPESNTYSYKEIEIRTASLDAELG